MIDLKSIPSFGVAGNFTGHLEQAGEASDFVNVKVLEANAPKAVFPTYIPVLDSNDVVPEFLNTYPIDSKSIDFPKDQDKLQIEPECAVIFDVVWNGELISELKPVAFAASNDCSIRREGARKISLKKNWGASSKGVSDTLIPIDSFDTNGNINDYRIASFLVRDGVAYKYGENSLVRDYSYVYKKLTDWLIDKFNNQPDEGPAENIHSYLLAAGKPSGVLVSIGATRYTEYGETNYLRVGDHSVVILYSEKMYSEEEIMTFAKNGDYPSENISVLDQILIG